MSYILVQGGQLRARGQFTRPVRCRMEDITRLHLSNDGAIFGMTRPFTLTVQLTSGQRKTLNGDMKRFAWLDVFRLADVIGRPCDGPAMPYLALLACSGRKVSERGTIGPTGGWALIQRLRSEGMTGKLVFNGSSGESWIYLIKGRNLRLEEHWPRDVQRDAVAGAASAYVFERSALHEDDIALVLRMLDDRWLGTPPAEGLSPAQSTG